jgi:hypothetical protein
LQRRDSLCLLQSSEPPGASWWLLLKMTRAASRRPGRSMTRTEPRKMVACRCHSC